MSVEEQEIKSYEHRISMSMGDREEPVRTTVTIKGNMSKKVNATGKFLKFWQR
jgi:hypothetical protein